MSRILGTCVAVILLVGVVYLFGGDFYHRYQISQRLDPADRAAFNQWNGDATSFVRSLLERCELQQGRGAAGCERYRLALR